MSQAKISEVDIKEFSLEELTELATENGVAIEAGAKKKDIYAALVKAGVEIEVEDEEAEEDQEEADEESSDEDEAEEAEEEEEDVPPAAASKSEEPGQHPEEATQTAEKEAAISSAKEEAIDTANATAIEGDSIDVIENGRYVRTYSKQIHKAGYMDLAKEFVSQPGHSRELIASDRVIGVEVRYRFENKKEERYEDRSEIFNEGTGPGFKEAALRFSQKVKGSCVAQIAPEKPKEK